MRISLSNAGDARRFYGQCDQLRVNQRFRGRSRTLHAHGQRTALQWPRAFHPMPSGARLFGGKLSCRVNHIQHRYRVFTDLDHGHIR